MDFDILLTTRIREEVGKGMTTSDTIVHAVERTGGVITPCGIIMVGSFGAMMLSDIAMLQQFGFALMFAILVGATVMRMYLVPALMSLLDEWNWWRVRSSALQSTRTHPSSARAASARLRLKKGMVKCQPLSITFIPFLLLTTCGRLV